jgi:hypothetical protein
MSYLLPLGETIRMVLSDGGVAYVITSSWSLIRFREKDTANKLDVLLRKSLYPLAISLAGEEQSDVSEVMRLYKLYADHLYKKNDFEGAVAQYCHTIGFVQPSYVIRRFLDTQRITNLTLYLEKLHQRGVATKDHTTLLLTCYTKTNNTLKLSEFCQMNPEEGGRGEGETKSSSLSVTNPTATSLPLNYDVLTAIYTLNDAGFDEHALRLALLNEKHEEYLHISLNSKTKKDVDRALSYLLIILTTNDLSLPLIIELIYKFGSLFLTERPIAFTSLLIQLCVGSLDREKVKSLLLKESVTATSAVSTAAGEVENEVETHFAQRNKSTSISTAGTVRGKEKKGTTSSVYLLADCFPLEDALAVYADDEKYLRVFIEGVNEGMRGMNMTMPSRLTELLLELYLVEYQTIRDQLSSTTSSATTSTSQSTHLDLLNKLKTIENRVLSILDGASSVNTEYDISNALLLMHSFGFENGEMFLIEKLQSTDLILRRCIETGNERGIMRVLKREGRKDPELFVQVLTYFVRLSMTSSSSTTGGSEGRHGPQKGRHEEEEGEEEDDREEGAYDDDERWDLISEVLTLVERENVLTPMQIIPILSENPDLPLHIASKFLKRTLRETSEDLDGLEREVSHMKRIVQGVIQEGIAARQHKLNQQQAALSAGAGGEKKRGGNVSTRSGSLIPTGLPTLLRLDSPIPPSLLPSLLDDHDNDEDELEMQQAEAEREAEKKKWLGIKNAQLRRTNDHESFFGELEHCSDGFGTIAAYFGKTIIS